MKKNNFSKYAFVALLMAGLGACTDVSSELYSEADKDAYGIYVRNATDVEIADIINTAYAPLTAAGNHGNFTSAQEVASDEVLIPQRGGDWFDGGQWIRMHRHEYTPNEESFNNSWKTFYTGIAICNRLIVTVPKERPALKGAIEAELRALRAYYYMQLCDMFGNVPLFTQYPADLDAEAATKTRAEVYAFVEKELNEASATLSKDVPSTYGRMNFWAAKAALARLYLNAQVYTGTPQWQKAADAANEVLTSNKYQIETNYYANFSATNKNSRENIFVIPFDAGALKGFNLAQMTLHYESKATFNLSDQPWNGYCSLSEFYSSYDAADARRGNFIAGPQFASNGTTRLEDAGAESNDPDGKPLTFTPTINEHFPNCLRQAGVRLGKYKFETGATPNLNNDFPLFRLGDLALVRAEALWRLNPADATALGLFNQIRSRAGVPAWVAADMTADKILAERGREMFYEVVRRSDLIRFGKYTTAYGAFKRNTEQACKELFPIPQAQLSANKALKQNPCY